MPASTSIPNLDDPVEPDQGDWVPAAWLYFIWIVLGYRVYCKIGHSKNPASRYSQLLTGMPEHPYRIHLLPCLTVEQAQLFEQMFHHHLQAYQARGEWFTHPNVRHFHKALIRKLSEIFSLFRTFGYEVKLERIDLDGRRPVLHENGFVSHIVESTFRKAE